jgi:hypothetical protein
LSEINAGGGGGILTEYGPTDPTNSAPPSPTLLCLTPKQGEEGGNEDGAGSEGAIGESIFPSALPTLQNRYYNQNSKLNDEGYDSKGGLPHFAEEEEVNPEGYNKAPLNNAVDGLPTAAPVTLAPAGEATQLTVMMVMGLNVNKLREELRKRGWLFVGKKGELQERLKEVVINNVPVASGKKPRRHECMGGLDVTARWELLTPDAKPVPQPVNKDRGHHPPTKMDGATNPKYAMVKRFQCSAFTGTNEKIRYVKPLWRLLSMRNHSKERRRKM